MCPSVNSIYLSFDPDATILQRYLECTTYHPLHWTNEANVVRSIRSKSIKCKKVIDYIKKNIYNPFGDWIRVSQKNQYFYNALDVSITFFGPAIINVFIPKVEVIDFWKSSIQLDRFNIVKSRDLMLALSKNK